MRHTFAGLLSGSQEWLYHATSRSYLRSIKRHGLTPEKAEAPDDAGRVIKALWVADAPDMLADYGNLWLRFDGSAYETDSASNGELLVSRVVLPDDLQMYVGPDAGEYTQLLDDKNWVALA